MKFREAPLAALLAISLVTAPVAATAQEADSAAGASEGGGTALAWGLAAVFAVVMGILVFDGDDEEQPVSP